MIRLSHSALEVLHTCERKFQLDRLLTTSVEKQDYPATVLGKAYGAGVQSYMCSQDIDLAIYEAWKMYYPILEDKKRTEEICISLLLSSVATMDNLLLDWKVLSYKDNKKAVELSYRLDIDDRFYFVGYIDLVLQNIWNGRSAIMEVKTTALNLHDLSPLYQNSGQALGYSITLDKILGEDQTDYDVLYLVAQLGSGNGFSPTISVQTYPKSLQDRLNWFITLGMDVERLHTMLEHNIFPLRGSSCLQFMRACPHLGTCTLHGLDEYKKEEEDTIEYDFTYKLDDVIVNHIQRIGKEL